MNAIHTLRSAPWLTLVLVAGCASTQSVAVRTDPPGADVYLQRRGELEIDARVKGIPGRITASAFEEDFRLLGTAPVEYEFDLSEREVGVEVPEGRGTIVRHYKEGTIRVEREGYESVIRLVRFAGDAVDLTVTLQPLRPE